MAPLTDSIRARIREILLSDWDPSDASRSEYAHGLYDRYIDPVWPLIEQGDEEAIASYLQKCELDSMCSVGLGTRRLRPAARKLLTLRSQASESAPKGGWKTPERRISHSCNQKSPAVDCWAWPAKGPLAPMLWRRFDR